ncbi:MAG TPA: hypothetical protein VGM54_03110 [Chthoniobacter sp.]|jgi:hypothetical protein
MQRLFFPLVAFFCVATFAVAQLPTVEPPRNWKTVKGAPFQASLVSYDGMNVVFKMPNGARQQAPASFLSSEDQQYLIDWAKKQPINTALPDEIGVETSQVKAEVVSEDPVVEKYVYRTQHFEFESQGKFNQVLLRDVARNFEATYELLKALPWHIEPRPASGEYFRAKLFKTKEAYYAAGGLQNSSGIYRSRQEMFMVPFESIGVKLVGKSYAKDENFETHTMVHELTHEMMHFWLGILPQWVIEGTAEYTGTLPLHTGQFRVSAAKNGLRDYVNFLKTRTMNGVPEPYPLEELFPITNKQWSEILERDPRASHRLYFTSFLLVYYFMHLDGKGDGQLFAHYFRDVGEERKAVEDFFVALDNFKKQPGVVVKEDGSFTYPGGLTPPKPPEILTSDAARDAFQKRTLGILLDGRSEAELMKQIRTGYSHLGIRL